MAERRAHVVDMRMRMDQLAVLARQRLPLMLDETSGLYVNKVAWSPGRETRSTAVNALYSAMSLIGIQHDDVQMDGAHVKRTLDALVTLAHRTTPSAGLLGATIWALSVARDERAHSLIQACGNLFKPARTSSMDVGLVLAGLAAAAQAFSNRRRESARVAESAAAELLGRFSDSTQLFSGSARLLRTRHELHRRMTSFASQVYPIHALAQFARATESSPPPQIKQAADRLVETQGQLGQWWWIYSSRTGALVEAYPVYSVHQDAMAFMALAPLQNLGVGSYDVELARGLQWIFGTNEMSASLADFERVRIARCVQRRGADADGLLGMSRSQWRRTMLASWRLRSPTSRTPGRDELEILDECRPYELGWLLYGRSLIKDW